MNQHVTEWLSAYFDGELHGIQLNKVEEHLRSCSVCRSELEQMDGLSTLLKGIPPMTARTSGDQFAAQIGLRLPRRTPVLNGSTWQKAVNISWLAIPMSIILGWALSQAALLMISAIQRLGIDLTWPSWFSSSTQWIEAYNFWNLFDPLSWDLVRETSPWLDLVEMLVHAIYPYLAITVVTAISLCCWMVCWWIFHQRQLQQINRTLPS